MGKDILGARIIKLFHLEWTAELTEKSPRNLVQKDPDVDGSEMEHLKERKKLSPVFSLSR